MAAAGKDDGFGDTVGTGRQGIPPGSGTKAGRSLSGRSHDTGERPRDTRNRTGTGHPALVIAILLTGILLAIAVLAPVLTRHGPTTQNLDARFLAAGTPGHPLGTDDLGRDLWSRILHGGRIALTVGAGSVGIAVLIGMLVGITAGLVGGYIEDGLMLFMDAILSFPTILLAIAILAVFHHGLFPLIAAIGIVFTPVFARLVRAETRAVITEGFFEASRALGGGIVRTLVLHLLPNIVPRILVQASITFALAVVIESSLSFLGLGPPPPSPSWGMMLRDARNFLSHAPWLSIYPGIAIGVTVLSFNLLGDALSELFHP